MDAGPARHLHNRLLMDAALDTTHEGSGTQFWHPERPVEQVPAPSIEVECSLDDDEIPWGTCLPGSRLRILERISDGACGVVYRGEHVELLRPLAIKVLRKDMLGVGAHEQFLDEARITGRIESPHVVQVIDFGALPDGRAWYAMELLGGLSLDQLIARGPVETGRAIALLRMACKGLRAGHLAGFVHRDVKPQNLVVIQRGGREHLVVVDFGIAVAMGTKPDAICGTPEYMAREQIIRDPLDERTDVYALGCCAFELLTGTSLVGECTLGQALLKHDVGIRPRFPAEANVPHALQAIVRRCLEIDPAQRFADMVELEAALCEAQLECRIAQTRHDLELPAVDPQRRRKITDGFAMLAAPRRRRRPSAALVWSCASAAVIAILGAWPQEPAAKDLRSRAAPSLAAALPALDIDDVSALAVASEEAALPEPVDAPAEQAAAVLPPPTLVRPEPSKRVDAPARTAGASARDLVRTGRRALRRGDRNAALSAFRRALDLDPRGAAAPAGLADVYFDRGEHDRAVHFAKLAVQRDPGAKAHHLRLGDAYYRLARYREARSSWAAADRLGSTAAARRIATLTRSP